MKTSPVTPSSVVAAAERIRGGVVRTPTVRSRLLSEAIGGDVYLKLENRQSTGSYKERGALNALLCLTADERERGIVTASAGNHGQAVAYHGSRLGLTTTVVMPENTPLLKVRRTRDFGATVVLAGTTYVDAAQRAQQIVEETGARLLHPFDDPDVIAGQGTATLELLADADGGELDALVVPVGGGGLIAGAVLAVRAAGSRAHVIATQTVAYPSFLAARDGAAVPGGPTIAEGIAVDRLGRLPYAVVADAVRDTVLVDEPAIETAIAYLLEDEKIVAEGAGAIGVAALRQSASHLRGKRVGIIVCGGNIDLGMLAQIIVRSRMRAGRVVRIRVQLVDKPGELARVAVAIANAGVNVLDVTHHRVLGTLTAKHAELDVTVELERAEDVESVIAELASRQITAEIIRD